MIGLYFVISAAIMVILNSFYGIFLQSYSWWACPLMLIGFFLGLVILHLLAVFIMILTTDINKKPSSVKLFRFLVMKMLPMVVRLARVKIETQGTEKIPTDSRMLLVCNHQHDFDPVVIYTVFPDCELSFVGKKEIIEEMPLVARAMHRLNGLFIDRENDRAAAKTVISAIKLIKENEASVAIFPEGYTSSTCEILPLRNGALKIALKSGAPIAVCVLNNTREIPKNMFRRKTVVQLKLVQVITPSDYEGMNTAQLGDIIYNNMKETLYNIRNK